MQNTPPISPDPAPPADTTDTPKNPADHAEPSGPVTDDTVKETIESIVIAFILAFVFRAFIVEPFIIPTGSMAPTMLGAHLQMDCPSCGYSFDVGVDSSMAAEGASLQDPESADCPMCNYEVVADIGTKVRSGDRILVDKFSYHLTEPKRWDIVVFKAPKGQAMGGEPAPRTNFIKRLIGLPGERVCLLDGNVYIAPAGTDGFTIARKTDPLANGHWQKIQRTAWQPVYHSQYVPIESGLETGPGATRPTPGACRGGPSEASGNSAPRAAPAGSTASRAAMARSVSRSMASTAPRATTPRSTSSLTTNSPTPYETTARWRTSGWRARWTPGKSKAVLRLSTTARLDKPGNGIETLTAEVNTAGGVSLQATSQDGASRELDSAEIGAFKPGIAVEIELWLVDDEASVWVNGERLIVKRFDLSWDQIAQRPPPRDLPDIRIAVASDDAVELRRIELDRDIYYFADRFPASGLARAEARRFNGKLDIGETPLDLRPQTPEYDAEYFVLGDNQPASEDGRGWNDVDGWVKLRYFDGEERPGVVPRSLLVGRAFMVYYPAPHGSSPHAKGIFPDFGRMRFVH